MDGANGVGAVKVKELESYLKKEFHITLFNDGTKGKLNYECGADFVKVQQECPRGEILLSTWYFSTLFGFKSRGRCTWEGCVSKGKCFLFKYHIKTE